MQFKALFNFKSFLAVLLSIYVIWLIRSYDYHFIDNANLAFHEAGHFALMFFGDTIMFLGGTIFQLLLPLAIALYFLKQTKIFESGVCGIWLGESLMNVAIYMGDANTQALHLIGGQHDWHWLFGHLQILHRAESIAETTNLIAVAIVLLSLFLVWFGSYKPVKTEGY